LLSSLGWHQQAEEMPKQWEREAQRKKYDDHLRRMREMKPYIDDAAPKRMLLDSKKINERVSDSIVLH
jgi:hypothetical protein